MIGLDGFANACMRKKRTMVLFIKNDVEEAILLSERIYVISALYGQIKEEIIIDLPHPGTLMETESSSRFNELHQKVLEMIREEALNSFQQTMN